MAVLAIAALTFALPAWAQPAAEEEEKPAASGPASEELIESIRVIQQRPLLRRARFEAHALSGVGLTDTMFRHRFVSANMRYHIDEQWSVGASGAFYFSQPSLLFDEVTNSFEVFPERAMVEWLAGVDASWIPIYGKFAAFDTHIIHFDIYILAGGGVMKTTRRLAPKPTGHLGIGFRIYLNHWLAFVTEVRDHIYVENFNAGDEITNHVVFQGGLSFFFPTDFEYRFAR